MTYDAGKSVGQNLWS